MPPPDIHALEIEFAKNPSLDACIPLCEAYLAAKRHMEAMVVCKKGIKSAPSDPRGQVMLARVYLDQGKVPKAEQELAAVLRAHPNNPAALAAQGQLLLSQGRRDEAVTAFSGALNADPANAMAREALTKLGVATAPAMQQPVMQQPFMPQQGFQQPMQQPPMQQQMPMQGTSPVPFGGMGGVQSGQGAPQPGFSHAQFPAATPMGGVPFQGGFQGGQGGFAPQAPAEVTYTDLPPAEPVSKPLEHVNDFFAPDTLGFTTDGSNIETAGPGRLTILGFVPKRTGSVKTTIAVAVVVVVVAVGVVAWQLIKSRNIVDISKLLREADVAMADDKYASYKTALKKGDLALAIDSDHAATLATMAYAAAILHDEHKEPGMLDKAKEYLQRSVAQGEEPIEYTVSAQALLAYTQNTIDEGIAQAKAIQEKGGSSPLFELETFKLMNKKDPSAKDTQVQMRRLVDSVVNQTRIFNFLGWHYAGLGDWAKSEKYFDSALQNSREHPVALVGKSLAALERGLGLKERQADIEKDLKKVFVLKDDLSTSDLALAHFAKAQLLQWQGNSQEAEDNYKKAFELDKDNPLFPYLRGVSLSRLQRPKEAIGFLREATSNNPNDLRFFIALAQAQLDANQIDDAEKTISGAAKIKSNDIEVKLLKGKLKVAQKRYEDAISAFKEVSQEDGTDAYVRSRIQMSAAMRADRDGRRAVKFMETFLEAAPADATPEVQSEMWCELGEAYAANKNRAKAIQTLKVGIEQYRFNPTCHLELCRVLGRGPEAKQACKTYLTLAPRGAHAAEAKRRSN